MESATGSTSTPTIQEFSDTNNQTTAVMSTTPERLGQPIMHGARRATGKRKRKGVVEYALEHPHDFVAHSNVDNGQVIELLVCRFCSMAIGARSDRIKEHLQSKKHTKAKIFLSCKEGQSSPEPSLEHTMHGLFRKRQSYNENTARMLKESSSENITANPDSENGNSNLIATTPTENLRMWPSAYSEPYPVLPAALLSAPIFRNNGMNSDDQENKLNCGRQVEVFTSGNVSLSKDTVQVPPTKPQVEIEFEGPRLCIRWNSFEANKFAMFPTFLKQGQFVDVTLWCEGYPIECHKIILATSSMYFEKMFMHQNSPHPIIFLAQVGLRDMNALIEYMYTGQVSIPQHELVGFLKAGNALKIKGLLE